MAIRPSQCERTDYLIHGIRVAVLADDDNLRAAAHEILEPFIATRDVSSNEASADIRIRLTRSPGPEAIPEGARVWIDQPPVVCRATGRDTAFVEFDGRYVGRLNSMTGELDGWIPSNLVAESWMLGHAVLLPLLLEALRGQGLYSLHAAAVAHHGRVAIFPAGSGSGKTTLTLALVRAGFHLLSDDTPLLRSEDGRIEVFAFPEPVNVTAQTSAFFPELRPAFEAGATRRGKVPVDCARLYGDCTLAHGSPRAVIFPSIGAGERTVMQPMEPSEALLRLVGTIMPSTSPEGTAAQFALLSDLVRDTPCFQMRAGRDFDEIPRLIADLLGSIE